MTIRVDSAARYLWEENGRALSNLPLQKLLYLGQVEYAVQNDDAPLLDKGFQAWDYGPVVPALYGRLKMFGADEIDHNVFYNALTLKPGSRSRAALDVVLDKFGSAGPGKLIKLTHWGRGAWARRYEPGLRGISISQHDIAAEARARRRFSDEWNAIAA
jgi:uncharacterized phage-associated protein